MKRILLQGVHQAGDGPVEFLVRAAQFFNLVYGVKDGGVMLTPELPADLRERRGGDLLDNLHSYLARESDGAGVAANFQVLFAQVEMLADALLDQVDGDAFFLRRYDIAQDLLRSGERDDGSCQRSVSHQAGKSALELAHVGLNGAGDVLRHVVGQMEAIVLRLLLEDGDFRLQVGRLNVCD